MQIKTNRIRNGGVERTQAAAAVAEAMGPTCQSGEGAVRVCASDPVCHVCAESGAGRWRCRRSAEGRHDTTRVGAASFAFCLSHRRFSSLFFFFRQEKSTVGSEPAVDRDSCTEKTPFANSLWMSTSMIFNNRKFKKHEHKQ